MKIATAIGPEMNELMEKKLSMEELEMVSGGVEEEPDESVIACLIVYAVVLLSTVLAFLILWGLAALIDWIKKHKAAVVAALIALGHPVAAYQYKKLSDADIERIWTEAYRRVS